MDRPKRKSTMTQNDESNSASSSSKRLRQNKTNESSDIAGGSNISTGQRGKIGKSTSPRSIENLPSELLMKIIGLLPVAQWSALERVHPNIRDVVYTAWGSLKKIDIQRDLLPHHRAKLDGEEKFQDKRIAVVEKLCIRAPNLIEIAVGCSNIETDQGLDSIMAQLVEFKSLQRIDFGKSCLTTSSLSRFLRESASRDQLKEIVNVYASIRPAYLHNDHLSVAFDNNYNDKQLHLETMDFGVPIEPPIVALSLRIPWNFLARVDVSRLTTFRVMDTDIPQRILADFLDRSPQLRRLSFEFGCYDTQHANAIAADKRIISAVARMEGLESLIMGSRIYDSRENFGQRMMELLMKLEQSQSLTELGLVGGLTNPLFFNHIVPFIPNVESLRLEISNLTTPILDAIFLPRSDLRKLHVSAHIGSISSFNVNCIMQNAPTLESLILDFPFKTFSRDDLKALGGLKELRELKLNSKDQNMDDALLEAWADGFGAILTKLEIRNYGSVLTGNALVQLVEKAPNLKTLIIRNYSITDGCLETMAALSPKIEEFGFDFDQITKIGLQHVVDGFRRLKKLILCNVGLEKSFDLDFGKYRVVDFSKR